MIYADIRDAKKYIKQPKGFTIVELIIVIIVIAILVTITVIAYSGMANSARQKGVEADARSMAASLTKYKAENGTYPSDLSSVSNTSQFKSTFQYTYNTTTHGYCLTSGTTGVSVYIMSGSSQTTVGACPGHGLNGQAPITNLALNPSIESNTTSWAPYIGLGAVSRTTTTAAQGSASLSAVGNNTATSPRVYSDITPVQTGDVYFVSFYVKSTGAQTPSNGLVLFKLTNGGSEVSTYQSYTQSWTPDSNGWVHVQTTTTVPSGGNGLRITPGLNVSANYTGTMYVDGLMVVKSSDKSFNYADGSSSNWVWNGAVNNSTSTGPAL